MAETTLRAKVMAAIVREANVETVILSNELERMADAAIKVVLEHSLAELNKTE
jgi:hypothetical protein